MKSFNKDTSLFLIPFIAKLQLPCPLEIIIATVAGSLFSQLDRGFIIHRPGEINVFRLKARLTFKDANTPVIDRGFTTRPIRAKRSLWGAIIVLVFVHVVR